MQGAQPSALHDNIEGWYGVEGGREVQDGGGIYVKKEKKNSPSEKFYL